MKKVIAALIVAFTTQAAFGAGIISGDDEDAGVCAVLLFAKNRDDDAVRVIARASDRAKAARAGQDFVRYISEYRDAGNRAMFQKMVDSAVVACARHGVRF